MSFFRIVANICKDTFVVIVLYSSVMVKTAEAQNYTGYGSLGFSLTPVDSSLLPNPNVPVLYWISFGDWRNDTGIASPQDLAFDVNFDKAAGKITFSGNLDGDLRQHVSFASIGKVRGSFTYVMTGINFGLDPLTNLTIPAIGRSASGTGQITLTSPNNSVNFGPTGSLTIYYTDKYKMPGGNTGPLYGPFDSGNFDLYVGPRFVPGNLFFTGTGGLGLGAWLMYQQNFTINGISFKAAGGDFHGDLVPNNIPPMCSAGGVNGSYSNVKCSTPTTTVKLDGAGSIDPDNAPSALIYRWTSDCPNASFDDANAISPQLTFSSLKNDGTPVSCKAFLSVSDGVSSAGCEAGITVGPCLKDCKGTVNGTSISDRCGVCDGNGTSCLGCSDVDIRPPLLALDQGTKILSVYAARLARAIRREHGGPLPSVTKLAKKADSLHNELWRAVNSLPSQFKVCTNSTFCIQTSFSEVLARYREGSLQLLSIINKLASKLERILIKNGSSSAKAKKRTLKLRNKAAKQHGLNRAESLSIPPYSSTCS